MANSTNFAYTRGARTPTNSYIGAENGTSNFVGFVDEFAIWSRALGATEIKQLYQRGGSRIKFQTRSCIAADCSNVADTWKGPDGSAYTSFSELNNMSTQAAVPSGTVNAILPNLTLQTYTSPVATNRYFQYRAILESDTATTTLTPELKTVTIGPTHYDTSSPTVVSTNGVNYYSISNYIQTLGTCASGVTYNLGVGASAAAATWYWWNPAANSGAGGWVAAGGTTTTSSSAATIASHAAAFSVTAGIGAGTAYFKAFLNSSGSTACSLSNIELDGQN